MNHFFYQTKTKFSNTGDVLINKALIDLLRSYGTIHVNDSSIIPSFFIEQLGIKDSERMFLSNNKMFTYCIVKFAIKRFCSDDKVFIVSGLGHNYGNSLNKVISNVVAGVLFPLLRVLKVKIIRIGGSMGPFSNLLAKTEYFRSIFINYYFVRDTESLNLCHSIGIKKAKICPDLSWVYNPLDTITDKKNITVNLRSSTLDEFVYEDYKNKIFKNLSVILFRMVEYLGADTKIQIVYQVAEDKSFAEEVYLNIKFQFNTSIFIDQLTLETAKKYYGNSLFTISNRMHSLLLCHKYDSLSIPLIDKTEHVKITATFKDANLEELIQDINNDVDFAIIDKIIAKRSEYLKSIKSVEKKYQLEIEKVINKITQS